MIKRTKLRAILPKRSQSNQVKMRMSWKRSWRIWNKTKSLRVKMKMITRMRFKRKRMLVNPRAKIMKTKSRMKLKKVMKVLWKSHLAIKRWFLLMLKFLRKMKKWYKKKTMHLKMRRKKVRKNKTAMKISQMKNLTLKKRWNFQIKEVRRMLSNLMMMK